MMAYSPSSRAPEKRSCLRRSQMMKLARNIAIIATAAPLTASRAVTAVGKKSGPAAIESEESTRQDPVTSPKAMSRCPRRRAVMSTISSGSDVPMEAPKKLIRYSGTRNCLDSFNDSLDRCSGAGGDQQQVEYHPQREKHGSVWALASPPPIL